mmetsp:Transcript_15962/g.41023  ORF Transcript_15962/g.41023 Transcript_15962/m.41023 type:complete len:83 (+) Transcript_15962:132-380(+)
MSPKRAAYWRGISEVLFYREEKLDDSLPITTEYFDQTALHEGIRSRTSLIINVLLVPSLIFHDEGTEPKGLSFVLEHRLSNL